jgi:hypothetical protein
MFETTELKRAAKKGNSLAYPKCIYLRILMAVLTAIFSVVLVCFTWLLKWRSAGSG